MTAHPAAVNASASSWQPALALVSVSTKTCSSRPASQESWRRARSADGLPMFRVSRDRPVVVTEAPGDGWVQGKDTGGDGRRELVRGAASRVEAPDRPAVAGQAQGGLAVQRGLGLGGAGHGFEPAVPAAPG